MLWDGGGVGANTAADVEAFFEKQMKGRRRRR